MRWLWHIAYRVAYRALRCYWFLLRPTVPSAHVVVIVEDRLLLIRNSYKPGYSVPAGGIGRNETPKQAAARELREEVGIVVEVDTLRDAGSVRSREEHKEDIAHFFELELKEEPTIVVDDREVIWAEFKTVDEARSLGLSVAVQRFLDDMPPRDRRSMR